MTHIDTGTYGAKRQSWRKANPRDFLKRIIDEMPSAGRDAIFLEFKEQIMADTSREEYLDSVLEYWFSNNFHSLTERPTLTRRVDPAAKAERAAKVQEVKQKIVARVLDMPLPNGLTLAESTFGYCKKLGGGLSRIGAAGKARDIVGKHLSEVEVRRLYNNTAATRG